MSLQGKNEFQVFSLHPVIQETVITDLLETGWKHMHQEPPDEFCMLQGDLTFRLAGLFAPGREGDLLFRDGKDTAVGNGDLMGVSSKVFDGISKTMKGFFDVRTPILFIKFIFPVLPFMGILQSFTGGGEAQLIILEERIEQGKVFSLELIPEDIYGDEKSTGSPSDLMGFGQSTTRNDTVHVHMVIQLLVPCMEYLDDPGCCTEILLIGRQFKKCFGTASVKKAVQKLLVTINEWI